MLLRAQEEAKQIVRCGWVPANDPLYTAYHDEEWGRPGHDERKLFELICLEGQQAGLSWQTILKKRAGYREAFSGFDYRTVAQYDASKIESILESGLTIKSRQKMEAIVANAQAALRLVEEFGSLDAYFWGYAKGQPTINSIPDYKTAPCHTPTAEALAKDLKKRGFKFVGATTVYAFMQAVGMVDDHENHCDFKTKG